MNIIEKIESIGIVPVVTISDPDKAVPLGKALAAGGIPCVEITLRTAEGEECIRRIAAELPDMLVGAGTVLSAGQAERAVDAGARFIVSPGFSPVTAKWCIENKMLYFPGCMTPTEMEAAMELGYTALKFFPAEQAGGIKYLKTVATPYQMLRFMPSGGISSGNLAEYMAFSKVFACGGSWMVTKELIDTGRFDEITRLCIDAKEIVDNARKG